MAALSEFGGQALDTESIARVARTVGGGPFANLYVAENVLRVVINSVLAVEFGPDWWDVAVDAGLQRQAVEFAQRHASRPWYSNPGPHGLYFLSLRDLAEVIRASANLFRPLVPDIDLWLLKIEDVRLPRNVVCHMNKPTKTDVRRISVFLDDLLGLANQLRSSGVQLRTP